MPATEWMYNSFQEMCTRFALCCTNLLRLPHRPVWSNPEESWVNDHFESNNISRCNYNRMKHNKTVCSPICMSYIVAPKTVPLSLLLAKHGEALHEILCWQLHLGWGYQPGVNNQYLLVDSHFLTCLLIVCWLYCHPIRSHAKKIIYRTEIVTENPVSNANTWSNILPPHQSALPLKLSTRIQGRDKLW